MTGTGAAAPVLGRGPAVRSGSSLSALFYWMVLFISLSAFNYGYGISELNALQNPLTCSGTHLRPSGSDCISMNEVQFGYVTALFTLGGFLSSLSLSSIASKLSFGPRTSIYLSAAFNAAGGAIISVSNNFFLAGLGRFVMGLGAGIAVVCVPVYLSDISPPNLKGSIGVLNQLGIVIGIFTAQLAGTFLTPAEAKGGMFGSSWRWVPAISAIISVAQLITGFLLALESPRWEEDEHGATGNTRASRIRSKLWVSSFSNTRVPAEEDAQEETEALLPDIEPYPHSSQETRRIGITGLLKDPQVRPGMLVVALTQIGQQLSGVNAVLYYSSSILGSVIKGGGNPAETARWIGVGITVVNAIMTFPPILLVSEHRLGRKKLLLFSSGTMVCASLMLGLSLQLDWSNGLSSLFIILFVVGFSVGLGPVPFLILPELVPSRAVSAASSAGLSLNWIANIVLASSFLPLRNFMTRLDGGHGGSIFWIFTILNTLIFLAVLKFYRYHGVEARHN